MNFFLENLGSKIGLGALPIAFWSLILLLPLGFLLSLGRRLEPAIRLEKLGIPIALLVGGIALFLGPHGFLPLMPQGVANIWEKLPTPLLTLIFASLMLGRPLPNLKGLWKPVASQAFLGLVLGFGQYFVGGLVVLYFLIPNLGVDPLMACLIEVGFEGGHGAAAVMAESFSDLGFESGADLGLAMATVGLLSSTLFGTLLVVIGRWRKWFVPETESKVVLNEDVDERFDFADRLKQLSINFALVGIAVLFGFSMVSFLQLLSTSWGGIYQDVFGSFPVFPFALIGSFLVRKLLELTEKTSLVSQLLQREIGTLSTDLLIITAMASLNLPLLINDWIPILILSCAGLLWNLLGILLISRLLIRQEWFERSITEFGNATGVAASGLLLLRLSDPRNVTNALPIFSIKQLFLQPLLSGGIVTVIAPLLLTRFGLREWTEFSGALTLVFVFLAFLVQED